MNNNLPIAEAEVLTASVSAVATLASKQPLGLTGSLSVIGVTLSSHAVTLALDKFGELGGLQGFLVLALLGFALFVA